MSDPPTCKRNIHHALICLLAVSLLDSLFDKTIFLFVRPVHASDWRASFPVGFPMTQSGFPSEGTFMYICICRTANRSSFILKNISVFPKSSSLHFFTVLKQPREHAEVRFPLGPFWLHFTHRLVLNFCIKKVLPMLALPSLSGWSVIALIPWFCGHFFKFLICKQ